MDRFSIVTSGFCVLTVLNLWILVPKNYLFKIHLKDIDDVALQFCILFIRTLSIVQFNKITTFQRLALSPYSGDKRERAKGR
jgi:hypothetical protein